MPSGSLAVAFPSNVASMSFFNAPITESTYSEALRTTAREIYSDVCETQTWTVDLALTHAHRQLDAALGLTHGWDSYDAEPPSLTAAKLATSVIEILRNSYFAPPHVVASVEGGLATVFSVGDKFAQIELLNSGSVFTTTYSADAAPQVVKFGSDEPSLRAAVQTVRDFLS